MAKYTSYNPGDAVDETLGDVSWRGVNMRLEPHTLPPGFASEAKNMRFRHGIPETRRGSMVMAWLNKISSGSVGAWGTIYGTGGFSDPNTKFDYEVIAADGAVYLTIQNNYPTLMPLPPGQTITEPVTFTQAFDKLVMWRGKTKAPLICNSVFTGWEDIPGAPVGTGNLNIPNAERAIFFQNRLIIPHGDDEIAASDIGDITSYSPTLADFKINQGSTDKIVGIIPFNNTTLIIFKERSIYVVGNVFGDLSEIVQDIISIQFGCVAANTIVQVGKDIWFMSQIGVMSINQTEQNKLQATALPISEPMQPIMDRINWRYISDATAAYWDSKFYIALPIDDAISIRENLIPVGTVFSDSNTLVIKPLVADREYRFTQGSTETLTNGATTYTSSKDFVAAGTSVTLNGGPGGSNSFIEPIFKGINNVVLVFDFLNNSWSGYDEAPGLEPKHFFNYLKDDKIRLFFTNSDGWVLLYEEDYEDQLPNPYTTVLVTSQASAGNTISINGGATITAALSNTNTLTLWGIGTISNVTTAANNLIGNPTPSVDGGFSDFYTTNVWTHPGVNVSALTDDDFVINGMKLTSTNGKVPQVTYTGTWATVVQVNMQPIESMLITRAYGASTGEIGAFHEAILDVQTWNPNLTVTLLTPGFLEEIVVCQDITRSRTKYMYPYNAPDWDSSNVNADFQTPGREDYSVVLPRTGMGIDNGVPISIHQETRWKINSNPVKGRATQIKTVSTTGRMRVMNARVSVTEKRIPSGMTS